MERTPATLVSMTVSEVRKYIANRRVLAFGTILMVPDVNADTPAVYIGIGKTLPETPGFNGSELARVIALEEAEIEIGDVNGLQDALDGKAALVHTHDIGDVDGLEDALNSKSDVGHHHEITDVDGLAGALNAKAPIDSPEFTGTPKAPTPLAADDSDRVATTAYVQDKFDDTFKKTGGEITGDVTLDEGILRIILGLAQAGKGIIVSGRAVDGSDPEDAHGLLIALGHNQSGVNRQLFFGNSETLLGIRVISNTIDGFNLGTAARVVLTLGTDTHGVNLAGYSTAVRGFRINEFLYLPDLTETQRDALTGVVDGYLIYNTDDDTLEVRAGGAWVSVIPTVVTDAGSDTSPLTKIWAGDQTAYDLISVKDSNTLYFVTE